MVSADDKALLQHVFVWDFGKEMSSVHFEDRV